MLPQANHEWQLDEHPTRAGLYLIRPVGKSSGFTVDPAGDIWCGCADWRVYRRLKERSEQERLCKHLRAIYAMRPDLCPPEHARWATVTVESDAPEAPEARVIEGVVAVPLYGRGGIVADYAYIDPCDAESILAKRWKLFINRRSGKRYAYRHVKENCRERSIYMHRAILQAPPDKQVDHRDGDGLNNTRDNIRLATPTQNHANEVRRPSASGYKGVRRLEYADGPHWTAEIKCNRKKYFLGSFSDPIEAARAYDSAAARLFGEFARFNFPTGPLAEAFDRPMGRARR